MSQLVAWLSTMCQQALAILIGGSVAVGWGREWADRVREAWEDRRWRSVAYIDVPSDGGNEAYYYVGSSPPPKGSSVPTGQYRTYREVSDPYVRHEFIPKPPIRSRRKLYLSLMAALLTQGDGHIHILQDHPLRPSQNSWQPGKPLGRFESL
jgi:hypothetical protein